jgi:hypothetical protein
MNSEMNLEIRCTFKWFRTQVAEITVRSFFSFRLCRLFQAIGIARLILRKIRPRKPEIVRK